MALCLMARGIKWTNINICSWPLISKLLGHLPDGLFAINHDHNHENVCEIYHFKSHATQEPISEYVNENKGIWQ